MSERILEFIEVINGNWTSSGNFLGEDKDGGVVHIYKKQIESFGFQQTVVGTIKSTYSVKLPLFVLAYNKEFNNKNNTRVIRLTAASIWKS